MSNLLVIDWDYFFRNPMESGDFGDDGEFWLYDWGHNENWSPALLNHLWVSRASGFLRNNFPLPTVDVPDNWWSRFNIAVDAVCELSDSNMYSGVVDNYAVFDHVWLFDAHHDLYRIASEDDLAEWENRGEITCEDWMFTHYVNGSTLHWRWPQWLKNGDDLRKNIPEWVGCDAREDDMRALDVRFDAVSICRSGSWVPPWCDRAFEQFYLSCPVEEVTQVDDGLLVRAWDDEAARQEAEQITMMMQRAKESAR